MLKHAGRYQYVYCIRRRFVNYRHCCGCGCSFFRCFRGSRRPGYRRIGRRTIPPVLPFQFLPLNPLNTSSGSFFPPTAVPAFPFPQQAYLTLQNHCRRQYILFPVYLIFPLKPQFPLQCSHSPFAPDRKISVFSSDCFSSPLPFPLPAPLWHRLFPVHPAKPFG